MLLALAALAVGSSRRPGRYRGLWRERWSAVAHCLVAALRALAAAPPAGVVLPLGLPWIGAHFRIDALSAFFLAVVNLGAAAASLFALGYGRHEQAPLRVLPFFPPFSPA